MTIVVMLVSLYQSARVAELVDAQDLGSCGATCESSSLSSRTFDNRYRLKEGQL